MKKLFFTAIALVAFSGVSLAGTISNKGIHSNQPKEKKSTNRKVLKNPTFCQLLGTIAANNVFVATGDMNAATNAGIAAQISCILGGN